MQSSITGMAIALRPPAIAIGDQSIDLIRTPPRLQHKAASKSSNGGKNRRNIPRLVYNLQSVLQPTIAIQAARKVVLYAIWNCHHVADIMTRNGALRVRRGGFR